VRTLCEILKENVGKEYELNKAFARFTVDVLGRAVFATHFNSQKDPTNHLSQDVESFLNGMGLSGILLFFPFWYKYPVQGIQKALAATNKLMDRCRQIVFQRTKNKETHHNDLLQLLIDLNLDLENGLLPETLLFLIAGHETTANLLSWTICLVAQHPEVEEKIVQEINTILDKNKLLPDVIEEFQYLDCVIQETLRLYPPGVVLDRQTNSPVEIDGKFFPKDSVFLVPVWVIHHDETYWPNPEKFDPTRFDTEHKNSITPFSHIPFGAGPRICIGMKFALTEAKIALINIYQRFTFKLTDLESCKPFVGGGLLKPTKLLVNIKNRGS